ncbi:MAG: peroxidase family protein [Planctomycetota bacterium]
MSHWKTCSLFVAGVSAAMVAFGEPQTEERRTSVVQRPPIEREAREGRPHGAPPPAPAHFPLEFRSIDGAGNNIANPAWGAAGVAMIRLMPSNYADGIAAPADGGLPSARAISNAIAAQDESILNPAGASDYLWQWGQFLDHDIDETPIADPAEAYDIEVPAGDPWFDPTGLGTVEIGLDRSAWELIDGARHQLNNITAFIDASNVYGSEHHRTEALRRNDGTGRLATSDGELLPFNTMQLDNAPTAFDPSFFAAGDIRANEQIGLTAMHTLFVREHNFWADQVRDDHPELSGDEVFEHARAIVAAEMQAITYREFLPLLLGPDALPPYVGYRPDVNPGIANEFATAGYRVGHTMLSSTIRRLSSDMQEAPEGHIALLDAFFNPAEITDNGIDSLLRGLATQRAQMIDGMVIDDVRNFLFGAPGSGGFDLASLNIQRGRDHGLPSYNDIREKFGLPRLTGFAGLHPDPDVYDRFESAYGTIDDVDAWVGLLSEQHAHGALVGETLRRLLADQFARLRDGDRFWYTSYLPPHMVDVVEDQTLSVIIQRNTTVGPEIGPNVFLVPPPCPGDFNLDGWVNLTDFAILTNHFGVSSGATVEMGDINGDGAVNLADFQLFASGFGAACN